jgi:hypothetical protein
MAKRKQLSKKQLAVIDDLFAGQFDEQAILDKHKVSRNIYNKWLTDEKFTNEFDRRIAALNRQSKLITARYAPLAAARLVQLTESEKEETCRKACLDIISLPPPAAKKTEQSTEPQNAPAQEAPLLSDETASRLLSALAQPEQPE